MDLNDKRVEKFMTDDFEDIADLVYHYRGNDRRTRVSSLVKRHIKQYMDIHDIVIEHYVLEWCYDKRSRTFIL